MAPPVKSPLPAMLVAVGSMGFWTLVIIAAVEESDALIGVALGLGAAIAVFAITVAVKRSRARSRERARILDQGTLAKARILSAKNNGAMNNDPYVDFLLEVQPEGGDPYEVSYRTLVSQMAIPRVQPESVVDVYVDPTDRFAVVIDPKFTS
ncbi:hypothetical protein F0U44_15715 [Nocardioides humilatus]|uniref:DUF3592 domain-containing protein n=1 Tax=Nocardioides humilatus TaxID=2607660 RepID=A0A5B1LBW1_9ACTN|nr:hypothetical protein [Nocardioides humilatus]KAA1417738.1 hypothetical protein F0U44_15715 [Nocardioides humilatus]